MFSAKRRMEPVSPQTLVSATTAGSDRSMDRLRISAMYVLSMIGWVTGGLSTIAALIWAYIERGSSNDPFVISHCTNEIRSFWITIGLSIVFFFLAMVFVGVIGLIVLPFWHLYRNIKGLVYASKGWAYDQPNVSMA